MPHCIRPRLRYYKRSYSFNPQSRFPDHSAESTGGLHRPNGILSRTSKTLTPWLQHTRPHRRILVFPFYIGCISHIARRISRISGYIAHIAYSAPDIAYIAYIGLYIAYIACISRISRLYRGYRGYIAYIAVYIAYIAVYIAYIAVYIAYIDVYIAYIARISLSKLRLKLSLTQQ